MSSGTPIHTAIIGAGNLGSRHLQSLLESEHHIHAHVVDPSQKSLDIAMDRTKEIEFGHSDSKAIPHSNLSSLPNELQFVVIATAADIRRTVLEQLVQQSKIHHLVFEKVLFQSVEDYVAVENILKENEILAWVNCPRRMYPFFDNIKKYFHKDEAISMTVDGNNWGLASNTIHLLDLVSFLNDCDHFDISTTGLQNVKESRRANFYEIFGTLHASQKTGGQITLTSRVGNPRPSTLSLFGERANIIIIQDQGKCLITSDENEWKWEEIPFSIIYQSALTKTLFEQALEKGTMPITSFESSKNIHLPLIKSLTSFFETHGLTGCPIT